jgi:hypothetical protein
MLEEYEMSLQERAAALAAAINEAWEDPRPSVPAADVFARVESVHAGATIGIEDAVA